ncbi:MAG: nucleotidyltransferase family protein [Tenuifilaceae bacterium]|nr:nucleotidyltransferase family protein [Tenuifilaceae bacterium]
MKQEVLNICIQKSATIKEALQQMDRVGRKLLIVTNHDLSFFGLLSIGDIQRAIIKNLSMNSAVDAILREDITVAKISDDFSVVKERMKERRNEFMPVLDENNGIVDVIFWENLFKEKRITHQINLPVIIMAGGRGSRLKPLTNIIPKPLIPISKKTIIEDIMDRFVEHGCNEFYLSVNYKADMIRYYFDSLNNSNYHIYYFQEDNPLGTAGSLSLLKGKIKTTFFVSNCDILIDEDYTEILKYHQRNKNDITLVAALKTLIIPYGTLETSENGILTSIVEKPEISYKINSGMYIIEPHILRDIPDNTFLHITDLIENIIREGGRVGVFPISENAWSDMGSLAEYKFMN